MVDAGEMTGRAKVGAMPGSGFDVLKSCLCLCLGFSLHLTYIFCLYLTTRQAWHIFFTLDRTFIFNI